jgi:ketosteroid isomerase-like protein
VSDAEKLRAMLAEWGRGDFRGGLELFAEDIRFSGAQPEGQVEARGPDDVARFMRRFLEDWERYTVETHGLEELSEGRYVATGTQHGKGRTSAMDITAPVSIAVRVEDGRIVELHFFLDRQEALEALEG